MSRDSWKCKPTTRIILNSFLNKYNFELNSIKNSVYYCTCQTHVASSNGLRRFQRPKCSRLWQIQPQKSPDFLSLGQLFRSCIHATPFTAFHSIRSMTSSIFRSFYLPFTSHLLHRRLHRYLFFTLLRSAPLPSKFATFGRTTAVQSNENELVDDLVVENRQLNYKIIGSAKSDSQELSAVASVTDVNSCKSKMSDRLGQSTFSQGFANAKGMNEYRGTDFITDGRLNKVSPFIVIKSGSVSCLYRKFTRMFQSDG